MAFGGRGISGKFPRGYLRKLAADLEATKQAAMDHADGQISLLSGTVDSQFDIHQLELQTFSGSFHARLDDHRTDLNALSGSHELLSGSHGQLSGAVGINIGAMSASFDARINLVDDTVDNILSGSTQSLDTFVEVVQAFEAADGNLHNSITNLSTAAAADRELIRQELSASATQINNNISLLSSSVSDTITNLSSSVDATIRAATFATASQGLSNVAGTTLILAGGDGYKYNFTIDDSGTPCITRIEQVSDLVSPDCVVLQGDDGNKYKIHVDSQGTLSVPQIVSASAYDPNDPCNVSENNIC
jgi:hypothetical protein